jgi:hypothetical protein
MSTDTALIESVLLAAGLPDAEVAARVADIGPDIVAEAVLAEVVCRAALLDGPADKLVIQCDLGFDGQRLGYLLVLGDSRPYVEKGWDGEAPAIIRQDLEDLLRELFGPPGPHGATRELFTKRRWATFAGMRQVVGALSQRPKSLSDLAVLFGSDKWGIHWYTPHYERYFEPYRELAVRVLEIGVGGYEAPDSGGESLRMWKHYFRRGLIYGLDLFAKHGISESRLHVVQGDQGDARFLDSFARQLGTAMAMVKGLLDGLNHQEQMRDGNQEPSTAELTVTGVHFHHNLAVIEKGVNTEEGSPAEVAARPGDWYLDK